MALGKSKTWSADSPGSSTGPYCRLPAVVENPRFTEFISSLNKRFSLPGSLHKISYQPAREAPFTCDVLFKLKYADALELKYFEIPGNYPDSVSIVNEISYIISQLGSYDAVTRKPRFELVIKPKRNSVIKHQFIT